MLPELPMHLLVDERKASFWNPPTGNIETVALAGTSTDGLLPGIYIVREGKCAAGEWHAQRSGKNESKK